VCCRFIRGKNSSVAKERLTLFSTVPVIKDLPASTLKALALVCTPRTFAPSTVILNQDQETEDLYVIAAGEVKLIRELPNHQNKSFAMKEFLKEDLQKGCKGKPDHCKLQAHRRRVLASGQAKV
jgi:hypothetical protein